MSRRPVKLTRTELEQAFKSGAWVSQLNAVLSAAVLFGLVDSTQASIIGNACAAIVTAMNSIVAAVHTTHLVVNARAARSLPPARV